MTEPQVRGTDNPVEAFRNRLPPWTGMREEYDAALDWERRRTVELMREGVRNAPRDEGPPIDRGSRFMVEVYRILDEVAALDPATPGEEDQHER